MNSSCLIVLFSYFHHNTEKIAKTFAEVLDGQILKPRDVDPQELTRYKLVGFGSGIYDYKQHKSLFDLADKLPRANDQKVFLFSTCGVPAVFTNEKMFRDNHAPLRDILESKDYDVVGEFSCAGFNTNSFLKYFGGINKGRPNTRDLANAKEFALSLKKYL
ncbi:MAG: flavodoxin family protein [Dehalococcoidales bacterium]|nr:MAG: flavodoxin family protein [Dehalococcoidales bacterium]